MSCAAAKEDPNQKLLEAEKDKITALQIQYRHAKSKFNSGDFGIALNSFRSIKNDLTRLKSKYNQSGRMPAAMRDDLKKEILPLSNDVDLGINTTLEQLDIEFKVQLEDAKAHIQNGEFVFAKNIYDEILRTNPSYERVLELREDLYAFILSKAKRLYQEALIDESIGRLEPAIVGFTKTINLLNNVNHPTAIRYYNRAYAKIEGLAR